MPYAFKAGIPYYYQIKEDIRRKINEGGLNPGDKIPTESDLVLEYSVSRPTIRQALAELTQEGLLTRTRGRGTFVAQPLITDNARVFTTFTEPDYAHHIATRFAGGGKFRVSQKAAEDLELSPTDEIYQVNIVLERRTNKVAARIFEIPVILAPTLLTHDFDKESLYLVLREEYGLVAFSTVQTFSAGAAEKFEEGLLGVKMGTPIMTWQGVLYSGDKTPFARVKTIFRGDAFLFTIAQGQDVPEDIPGHKLPEDLLDHW